MRILSNGTTTFEAQENGVQGFGRGVPVAGRGGRIGAVTYKPTPKAHQLLNCICGGSVVEKE